MCDDIVMLDTIIVMLDTTILQQLEEFGFQEPLQQLSAGFQGYR